MQKRRTWKARAVVKASLLVFLIIAVLAPLICLLFSIGSVDVGSIVGSRQFLESLKNSVLVTLTATAVSLVLALVLAWCIAQLRLGEKGGLISAAVAADADSLHFSRDGAHRTVLAPTGS